MLLAGLLVGPGILLFLTLRIDQPNLGVCNVWVICSLLIFQDVICELCFGQVISVMII